jgi:hypothetical protein
VQRQKTKLGAWLEHSTQSVDRRELVMLMDRLMNHEPDTFNSAAAILQTGDMPSLLFRPGLCTVNPALLYLMHASTGAGVSGHTYLPACPSAGSRLSVPTTAQSIELPCDAGEGHGFCRGRSVVAVQLGEPLPGGALQSAGLCLRSACRTWTKAA